MQALKAEKIIGGKIIPTLRSMSKSCGLSITIEGDKDEILNQLKDTGIVWDKVND
jgi:hypothetical protein